MSRHTEQDLEEIMQLFRDGRAREGVEWLYRQYYYKIYGIAFSIVKSEPAAEDVVHNTVCKLLKTDRSKFPSRYQSTWLYSVVKNEALLYLRKEKPVVLTDEEFLFASEEKSIDEFVDMDSYYAMLRGLNEQQRQIVTLKVLGGYTHKEIARMLEKPIGTVQWIYNTSIRKLRTLLAAQLTGVFVMVALLVWQTMDYIDKTERYIEYMEGYEPNPDIGSVAAVVENPNAFGMIVCGVLLFALLLLLVVTYKKSDFIPTKADKKSI